MGEQGAKFIHAKFYSIAQTYSGIMDPKLKLKSIMEYYLNVSPHISNAVPPPVRKPRKSINT